MTAALAIEDLEALVDSSMVASVDLSFEPGAEQAAAIVEADVDVVAAVDMMVDTMASAAYVDIVSTDDLMQALQDVGMGSPDVMADNPLADLMEVLAAAPAASNPLEVGVEPGAMGFALAEGLSSGIVADAGDFESFLDPAAAESPHHDVSMPTPAEAAALMATLDAQQLGGAGVQFLGGLEAVSADPFDPFEHQNKT